VKAYIAAPMFSDAEKAFNLTVASRLAALGIDTYLPQRDGGEAAPMIRAGLEEDTVRRRLFDGDVTGIRECEIFVFVLDGRVPDEGGCVELGIAYAWGKTCVGVQTDCRRFGGTDSNNLMIDYALAGQIAHSLGELGEMLAACPARTEKTAAGGNETA